VELRLAHTGEAATVRRLAALDDAPELEGQVLLALVDGAAVAAISLRDERVIADPFLPTRDVVAVLRLRAGHLQNVRLSRRRRHRLARLRPA